MTTEKTISRRTAMGAIAATAAGFAGLKGTVRAGEAPSAPSPNAQLGTARSVVSTPARDYTPGAAPVAYPDPDIIVIDPEFGRLRVGNAAIQRIYTGCTFTEGPAWNAQGRYLVWSDVPGDKQYRYLDEDGHVSVMRAPSNNANGNAFDFQGRLVTCEHRGRRVVRQELDGSMTVVAEFFEGKHLNSPNDVCVHPDGSYWFTDPPFGTNLYQGVPDGPGGALRQQNERINNRVGYPAGSGTFKGELPGHVYRVDAQGRVTKVIDQDEFGGPSNGLCFSQDYKKLFVISRGSIWAFDVAGDGRSLRGKATAFADMMVDGVRCGTDGMRCDVYGNIWASSNAGVNLGYHGVTVWNASGKLIGRIRLPESTANVTFGGPRRNRLFMTASQSVYAVYVETQGAAPS